MKKRAAYREALAKPGTQDSRDSALNKPFNVPVDAQGTDGVDSDERLRRRKRLKANRLFQRFKGIDNFVQLVIHGAEKPRRQLFVAESAEIRSQITDA